MKRFSVLECNVAVLDVGICELDQSQTYDLLIMGIPSWDFGGIKTDWEDLEREFMENDLKGKTVALYGLGDQQGFGDYFLDAIGWLHERVVKLGASNADHWPVDG